MQIVAHFQPEISILKRTMSPQSLKVFGFQEQKKSRFFIIYLAMNRRVSTLKLPIFFQVKSRECPETICLTLVIWVTQGQT